MQTLRFVLYHGFFQVCMNLLLWVNALHFCLNLLLWVAVLHLCLSTFLKVCLSAQVIWTTNCPRSVYCPISCTIFTDKYTSLWCAYYCMLCSFFPALSTVFTLSFFPIFRTFNHPYILPYLAVIYTIVEWFIHIGDSRLECWSYCQFVILCKLTNHAPLLQNLKNWCQVELQIEL